jgi:flagellar biosynthesis protein FlhG
LSGYLGRIKLWSIGGGKGGIGKSLVSLGLGISLSRLGKKVIMIDGDLGGANLHTLMGVRYPHVTLEHFMKGKVNRLEDVIIPTQVEDIGLICGADSIIGSANPTYSQKMRLLNQIEVLPAQYVLLDLGAGTAFNTLDFFNYSQIRIVLFTSQTTSLQNVYGFIKSAIYRKIARDMSKDQLVMAYLKEKSPQSHYQLIRLLEDYQLFLVVNMVKSNADLNAPDIISSVCNEFLTLRPEIMGHVAYDPALEAAVNRISQVPLSDKKGKAAGDLAQIALKILMESRLSGPVGSHKWQNWGITMNPRQSL